MISSTGNAINARDFDSNTKNPDRDTWGSGAMHHLVKALNGAPVAIVLDKQTGFVEFNVTLGGVRENGRGYHEVLVERTYSNGETGKCWYLLFQVGTVIILDSESNARWTALDTYREERGRALAKIGDKVAKLLGVTSRYDIPSGKFEVRLFPGRARASYTPDSFHGPVSYTWEEYSSAELATA